jgi:hypothetical protein
MSVVARLAALVGGVETAHVAPSSVRQKKAAAPLTRAAGKVVAMTRPAKTASPQPTPEEQIPLGDTGTFGSF